MTRLGRVLVAVVVSVAVSTGCVRTGPPDGVAAWAERTYTPALRSIHDPRLAPWRLEPATPAELRDGCAEVLRRHDEWDAELADAPDDELAERVEDYIAAERRALDACASNGQPVAPVPELGAVIDRLEEMGISLPQG